MSLLFSRTGYQWRCDGCCVHSTTTTQPSSVAPVGWGWDNYPGEPHHVCAECRNERGMDAGLNPCEDDDD